MPGCPGEPVVTTLVCITKKFAREAAGALGARHSPRPRGRKRFANSGASCRGDAEVRLGRHCEPTGRANARPMTGSAKQSRVAGGTLDCFVASLLAMTAFNDLDRLPRIRHRRGEAAIDGDRLSVDVGRFVVCQKQSHRGQFVRLAGALQWIELS